MLCWNSNNSTLNVAELKSHRNDLRLKAFLPSKRMDTSDNDPRQQGHQVSKFTTEIQEEVGIEELLDNDIRVLRSMSSNCDDGPSQSGFTWSRVLEFRRTMMKSSK